MDQLYENSDNEVKRQIIGSIFLEKMVFDGQSYRTTRVNEAVRLIWAMGAGFSENKNGQTDSTIDLSTLVTPSGDFSKHLVEDFKRLAAIAFIKQSQLKEKICAGFIFDDDGAFLHADLLSLPVAPPEKHNRCCQKGCDT
jgi:hypothetical protein